MTWWAIGIHYGERSEQKSVWADFLKEGIACNGFGDDNSDYFEKMKRIQKGDFIVARSTHIVKGGTHWHVKGIGIVIEQAIYPHSSDLGQCVKVDWILADPDNILKNSDNRFFSNESGTVIEINEKLISEIKKWLSENYYNKFFEYLEVNMFRNEEILKTVLPQIILQGPPGTSKTYEAKRLAARMIGLKPDEGIKKNGDFVNARYPKQINGGSWTIVQFHPAYNYEDFVRGIQVQTKDEHVTYETVNRILGKIARSALDEWNDAAHEAKKELGEEAENDSKIKEKAEEKAKKFVLIIDEINRANLAAVLGELIYALEYRGDAVDTPYRVKDKESNELIIPPNFYIIGTMNTADRSIGHIDYAVRRRFVFIPCLPDESVLDNYYEDTPLSNKAKKLFDLVANLFEYPENGYLSPDFYKDDVQVGHTYFIADSCEHLAMKFAYQVYPLLREYYKDGILVGGDVKINITEDTKDTEGLKFDIKTPEDSQKIYEEVQKWCKNNIEKKAEQSESASDSKKESDDNESSGDEKSEQTDKQPPADKQEDE